MYDEHSVVMKILQRGQGSNPVPLSSAGHSPLQVSAVTEFIGRRTKSSVGFLRTSLKLTNVGAMTLSQPYLSMPRVGIRIESGPGMVTSSRADSLGAIVLSNPGVLNLGLDESAVMGSLVMQVKRHSGGSVAIGGADLLLSDLTDIKLFYVVGADQIQPSRWRLTVPAEEIRGIIEREFPRRRNGPECQSWHGATLTGLANLS